jgi:predicted nucleic acid-binding protein
MALVLDTSGVYALLDRNDPDHQRCVAAVEQFDDFVVPPLVLVEVDHWCRKRGGGAAGFARFVSDIRSGAYRLEQLTEADLTRAAEVETRYTELDLGVVDASVIALCERLGEDTVLTLDRRDFAVVRPRHCPALRLLPE